MTGKVLHEPTYKMSKLKLLNCFRVLLPQAGKFKIVDVL